MKKLVSFVLCMCMVCAILPVSASETSAIADMTAVNQEFDSVSTNSKPSGIKTQNASVYVRQLDDSVQNKVLEVKKLSKPLTLDFPIKKAYGSMTFQFDLMLNDNNIARIVSLVSGSVTAQLFTIDTDCTLITADGKTAGKLEIGKWYTISCLCRFGEKRFDIYINGKYAASKSLMSNAANLGTVSALRFSLASGGYGSVFYLDNVRCYPGNTIIDGSQFPHASFNASSEPVADDALAEDNESVYLFADFNDDNVNKAPSVGNASPKNTENKVIVTEKPDKENKSLMISKAIDGDPYIDFSLSGFNTSSAVMEASFCSEDTASVKIITLRDSSAKFNELIRVQNGGIIMVAGKKVGTYQAGKWYKLVLMMDYKNMTIDAYLDGERLAEKLPFANMDADMPATIRAQIIGTSAAGTIYWDDLAFYAGSEIKTAEELKNSTSAASGSTQLRLIAPEEEVEAELVNAVAILAYGSKAYAGGKKTTLETSAAIKNGVGFVPLRYTVEKLGGTVSWNDAARQATVQLNGACAVYTMNSSSVEHNGQTVDMEASAYIDGNTAMVPVKEFSDRLMDAQISVNDKYGIVVVDADKKNLSSKQIKDIYDYIIYTRPTAEQILKDFEPMKNVHPRIMATAERFDEIARQIHTDENMAEWYKKLIADSETMLTAAHTYYLIPDGVRLLSMARQLHSRAYTLGMAYRLTKDQRYLDYLWGEIDAVCNFDDWNAARHFLDPAEMMTGVAIAYDWCYEFWTDEQRKLMEDSMLTMGLQEGEKFYNFMGSGTQWATIDNNWSMVCNGGMTVAALALLDIYPEYCSMIIETAFHSLENALGEFSPDGAWVEGPGYWGYAIQYLGYHMSALMSALGTDYGYLDNNNLASTGYYVIYTRSSQGSFNVGDGGSSPGGNPAVFYLARRFRDPGMARLYLTDMKNYSLTGTAFDMLYFDPDLLADSADLKLDYMFRDIEMTTFRSAWGDSSALFAGIKGGYNDSTHGNMDSGTFVIDAIGERWAVELGADEYNQSNYFTKEGALRYYLYFCSTQGQNVLALNPISELGQEQYGFTKITDFVSKQKGGYTIIDMSTAYGNKVASAYRGLKVDHDRTQIVVQDELQLKNETDVWWFMHTKASVEIAPNGKYAILTQKGKKMYVALDTNVKGAKFTVSAAEPLEGSSIKPGVYSTAAYRRLQIELPDAKGAVKLAVRFIPVTNDSMLQDLLDNGAEKMISISRWNIPDGEIDLPALTSLSVNGEPLEDFDPTKNTYDVNFDFGTEDAPLVEAEADENYTVEIVQSDSANGTAGIKVTDKEGSANYYAIYFKVQPYMGQPEGYKKHEIKAVSVSSEPQEENPKASAIDGRLDTRWSAEGINEWIKVDLGEVKDVNVVTLAFYSGTKRVTYFDIQLSADGKNWTTVFSGESSGLTDDYESYFAGEHKARYIKMNCSGNSINYWNSFSEIEIYGKQ